MFAQDLGVWGTVGALALHLIPAAVVLAALAIAWRWEVAGGLLFVLAGVAYAVRVDATARLDWVLLIAGPLWVTGGLFLMSGAQTRSRPASRKG